MLAALRCSYLSAATEEELTDSVSTNDGTTPVPLLLQPSKSANIFSTTLGDSTGKNLSSALLSFFAKYLYYHLCSQISWFSLSPENLWTSFHMKLIVFLINVLICPTTQWGLQSFQAVILVIEAPGTF